MGLLEGTGNSRLEPQATAVRSHLATVLYRFRQTVVE